MTMIVKPVGHQLIQKRIHQMTEDEYRNEIHKRRNVWDSLYRYGPPATKHVFLATDLMGADMLGSEGDLVGYHGVQFKNPLVASSRSEASEKLFGKNIYPNEKVPQGVSQSARAILDADDKLGDAAAKAGYDAIITPWEIQVIDKSVLPPPERAAYNEEDGLYHDESGNALYEGIGLQKARERLKRDEAN